MKYAWIEAQRVAGTFRVEVMCELLGVVRSAYYAWKHCPQSVRAGEDERLTLLIRNAFEQSRKTYGTRRIQCDLKALGEPVSTRRIGKLMKNAGLHCKTRRKFKATTNSKHTEPVADNLLNRQFRVDKPNTVWVGDITYIATDEGWFYRARSQFSL